MAYLIVLTPNRDALLKSPTAEEKVLLKEHRNYFFGLQESGKLEIENGNDADKYVRQAVMCTSTKEDAEFLALVDPAIQAGIFDMRIKVVHP